MDEVPTASGGIHCSIPQDIQEEIDLIAAKHPRGTATPADLDDNQKRWLVVGICLHSVISPALRKYVESILTTFHYELIRNYQVDTQMYPTHLHRDPHTGFFLNYEAINNNKVKYGKNIAKYDYTINDALDLSKLFLQTHMAHYNGFDDTCDSSALLTLILNIAKFDPVIKSDADDVRKHIRNPWAHCDFTDWDAGKYSNSFQLTKKLVNDLKLSLSEEKPILEEMEKWEINGQRFLSGSTHGFELVNELHQQTHVLALYATLVATEADNSFMKIKNELEKFEIIFNKIAQLDNDMKQGLCEIDKILMIQDKTLKIHETEIKKLGDNFSKCACHEFHNAELKFWKDQDVLFVKTPVVTQVYQTLVSKSCVLIVGQLGIGKTMLMHHIALQLQNEFEYCIISCEGIQDIRYHYKEDIKQMFVLDDICGRFTASFGDIAYLHKHEDTFKRMFEKGKTKMAATCRLDIYCDELLMAPCSVFTSTFNLSAIYSKKDTLKICSKYLTDANVQLLSNQNQPFTPLMCYLYSKIKPFNLTDFLHCLYETYRNEWEQVKKFDPYKYCALFLCVIHNGIINESLLDISDENISKNHKVLKHIFDICGITSLSKMKNVLDGIIGSYLRKSQNEYRVIHDQMFDFLCCYFGNNDELIRCILRHADIEVLNERTQLESINVTYGNFTIRISKKYERDYFARIIDDLKYGQLRQCFHNQQIKLEKYRAAFLTALMSIDNNHLIDQDVIKCNIITACFEGYYDIAKYFISKDTELYKGYSNCTPLTAACYGGDTKIVQLLIEKGCDFNQADVFGETPLAAACEIGKEKIVQLLIDKGCDANSVNKEGYTLLEKACERGNAKIVQILINKEGDVNQMKDLSTPLTAACYNGFINIAQLLIDKGADVNKANFMGQTPLIAACERGNAKIVQLLIDKGGDISQVYGTRIRMTPLTAACKSGNKNIVQLLIDKGCNVNQVDGMGETPLTAACRSGNENIVILLINKGGDVNQVHGIRETPLTAACERENEMIIKILIDKGCDVNQVDGMGKTPLTAACRRGIENIVILLINNGGDVNQVHGIRAPPLTAACERENEKIIEILIDKGCDVNQADGKGDTPLTAACKQRNEKIVNLLLDKGCDINLVNGNGKTPLAAARWMMTNQNIVQLLIDKGCDVNTFDVNPSKERGKCIIL